MWEEAPILIPLLFLHVLSSKVQVHFDLFALRAINHVGPILSPENKTNTSLVMTKESSTFLFDMDG